MHTRCATKSALMCLYAHRAHNHRVWRHRAHHFTALGRLYQMQIRCGVNHLQFASAGAGMHHDHDTVSRLPSLSGARNYECDRVVSRKPTDIRHRSVSPAYRYRTRTRTIADRNVCSWESVGKCGTNKRLVRSNYLSFNQQNENKNRNPVANPPN